MKKRSVKILSLVLALVMAFSLCPMQVFAEGNQWGWGESQGPEMPAQQLKATDNESSVTVTVDAPEGALPQGTTLNVQAVSLPAVQNVVDSTANVSGTVVAAVDITFLYEGTEIEPEKNVSVTLASEVIANSSNPSVLHLDCSADEVESGNVTVEVMGRGTSFKSDDFSVYAVVTHEDDDENARLEVRFFHHEDDTDPVYSVYVTKRDEDILGNIIDDPNVPDDLSGNELFCGWFVGTNYTAADVDGQHTVDYIREQVKTYLQNNDVHEGDTFDVYAMIFNYFNVAYVDENGETTLATDVYYSKNETMELTVQMTYAPYLQGYRFYGWEKDDGDSTIYQNGQTTTISQPVTKLRAQVQQGFWLSFEENPGEHYSGATYVPPVFCVNGVIPAGAQPTDPTLNGYTLGDGTNKWFKSFTKGATAEEDTWATPFSFSGTIDQDTTVYAKWTLNDEVPYTIIVWKQNIDNDKGLADSAKTYDYAFAVTTNVAPNTAISALDLSEYNALDGSSKTVDGVKHSFYGFKYNTTKGAVSSDTKVSPQGTTVVNLYYDRELVTYYFNVPNGSYTAISGTPDFSNELAVYYRSGSTYYKITNYTSDRTYAYYDRTVSQINSTSSGNYAVLIDKTFYNLSYYNSSLGWYFTYNNTNYYISNNTDLQYYARVTVSGTTFYKPQYTLRETFTGLYDQPLSKYNYTWKTDYRWYMKKGSFISIADNFTRWSSSDGWTSTFYGSVETFNANIYHFLMETDGTYSSTADFTIPCRTTNGMLFRSFTGFDEDEFRVKLPSGVTTYRLISSVTENSDGTYTYEYDGATKTATDYHDGAYWTEWIPNNRTVTYGDFEPDDMDHLEPLGGKIEFRYYRVKNTVNFLYGTFVTGRGVEMTAPVTGQIHQSEQIFYQASIDSFKTGGADYYDPVAAGDFTDGSFVFEGWFVDPGCTTAYDFTGKTMPTGGVTVYAKFRQVEYRVFLHVNEEGKQWSDVNWSDPDQASNFRIAYNGVISEGNPIEGNMEGYVLVGWYTDEACTEPFNFETRFTDAMGDLLQEYGAAEKADPQYYTDYYDDNGNALNPPINKDVDRPWINQMVHLYAKWRKVLPGATGITLVYDGVENTDEKGTFTTDDGSVYTVTDPLRYTDTSNFLSHSAATPDSDTYQFLYWEILDKNGQPTGEIVYPGMIHEVDVDWAVVTDAPNQGNAVVPAQPTRNAARGGTRAADDVYAEVASPVIGHSYLMGYVSGETVYLIGNTYYNSNNCPKSVTATVDDGQITGDYSAYLWTVGGSASAMTFNNATASYLGQSNDYLNFGTSNNTWTYSTGKVLTSTNTSLSYRNVRYFTGYFDVSSYNDLATNVITFFELVEQGNPVTYTKVETPVAGISYVIAQDGVNYAVSGEVITNTNTYLGGVAIERSGNTTVTIYDSQIAELTWTAGGNATNGWTWKNVGTGNYMAVPNGYLNTSTTESTWNYGSNHYFENTTTSSTWKYLGFNSSYYDYDTYQSGSAISIYARTHTLTINYVMSDGSTAPAAHVETVPEGVAYSVASPTVNGYTADQATVSGTMGTGDVTVTVTYTTDSHTVTFNWHGGSSTQTVDDGEYATAPADPANYTENGVTYIFTHWDPNPANTPITTDQTFTAQYKREGACIVTFKDWNGTVLKTQEVAKGGDATPPAEPVRPGFTFAGWDKDYTNVQSDLVVYATYRTKVEKIYTVTLRAVYGPRAKQELTHIVWYANNGTGDYMESEGVVMNQDIQIPVPAKDYPATPAATYKYKSWDPSIATTGQDLIWENHEFLGWARVKESDNSGNLLWATPADHPEQISLTYDDLFLKYDPITKTYTANQNCPSYDTQAGSSTGGSKAEGEINWASVNYVAADELMPYHAMYAVWGNVFYVYHSGTGKVERIVIDAADDPASPTKNTFNLTALVSPGFLYGGYYTEYAGMSSGFDATEITDWTPVTAPSAIQTDATLAAVATNASLSDLVSKGRISQSADANATKYDGEDVANVAWDLTKAYSTGTEGVRPGNAMVPEAGATYYIKEVPASMYLQPYTHFTYRWGTGVITKLFLISDIDDGNYQQAGFVIVDAANKATYVVPSITIKNTNSGLTETLTPDSVFGAKGVKSGYLTCTILTGKSSVDEIRNYWVTPDGLLVTGTNVRYLEGADNAQTIEIGTLSRDVPSTIGAYPPAA